MEKGIKKISQHIYKSISEEDDLPMQEEKDLTPNGITYTENGGLAYSTTWDACLDLFAQIGALRLAEESDVIALFEKAYRVNATLAMRILFYVRDAREGLGERRAFRILLRHLAKEHTQSAKKVIPYIAEYGRYDDLLCLLRTPCESDVIRLIKDQLDADMAALEQDAAVSLLGKWLPSANTSCTQTVKDAKYLIRRLGMEERSYRKMLSALRKKIAIIENHLRERDYSFDYGAQPAKAMLRYSKTFIRNDTARYAAYLTAVKRGEKTMHTDTLYPYEVVKPIFRDQFLLYGIEDIDKDAYASLDVTWNALPDFTDDENALVVMDGSGSMYCTGDPLPIEVASSLALYYADRNKGAFAGRFITFSERPQMVQLKGDTVLDKLLHCISYDEPANTNLSAVFDLLLEEAVTYEVPQSQMPKKLYIISDMEFDECVGGAEISDFHYAEARFHSYGYQLPQIVFWNVQSRHGHLPVQVNDQGVALVSGCSARTFEMLRGNLTDPLCVMLKIIGRERYAKITA